MSSQHRPPFDSLCENCQQCRENGGEGPECLGGFESFAHEYADPTWVRCANRLWDDACAWADWHEAA